jgi:hypothetical protein
MLVSAAISTKGASVAPRNTHVLARAVRDGRGVSAALRYLDAHRDEPDTVVLADALARFLVERCESHHAGWRTIRRLVVESSADPPWQRCARRAATQLSHDLLAGPSAGRNTRLGPARHLAAKRQAEQLAPHVDGEALLGVLGLDARPVTPARWTAALADAVEARSRQQVALRLEHALGAAG